MSFDASLSQAHLLDCTGQITHTLVLQPDGRVLVRLRSGVEALVCPVQRRVVTRGVVLDDVAVRAALAMARGT